MSTENLNNDNPQVIDKEWEEGMLSFVDAMNADIEKSKASKSRRQPKWIVALKRRFRPRTITLIATVTVTVILLGLIAFVFRPTNSSGNIVTILLDLFASHDTGTTTDTNSDDSLSSLPTLEESDTTEDLISIITSESPLVKIDIQNQDDAYTISYDKETEKYLLKGYEDIDLSAEILLTLRYYTETIAAADQVQNVTDLSAYGLDQPQATANITYDDGTSAQVRVGNKTPSDTGYYGQVEGKDGVYIFESDAVSLFRHSATSYVHTTLMSPPSVNEGDESGAALLKEITYSGTAHPTPLTFRRSNPYDSEELTYFSYIITAPYLRCTTDDTCTALSSVQSLVADQALYLHPTDEQKSKLGFDDPLICIDATMAVETDDTSSLSEAEDVNAKTYYNAIVYKIIVGSIDDNGNYIVMLDGVDAIFLVNGESYDFMLGRKYNNSVNEYLFLKNIVDLECISVEMDGEKHDFHLTHYPEKEDADQKMVVTKDDKVYPTEDFRKLYELIMSLERHGVPETEPSDKDVSLTLSLYDTDGNLYLSAQYYETTATLCTVKTSEGELLTTRWSDINFFVRQVRNYLNGDKVLISN